jgi:ribose-phosphate pyrophosphokinase
MDHEDLAIFALATSHDFGEQIGTKLGVPLSTHEERDFEDGEHKSRPLVNVRGKDVFVVQSLYSDLQQSVTDKLCRLLFFLGALRDASAARLTAIVPYLCYARKDRKSKTRDPVTTRYVASLFEFVDYFVLLVRQEEVVVVSPDVGGIKRAEDFRQTLSRVLDRTMHSAFMEKYRSAGVVSGEAVVGDVAGRVAIIIDDLISSGTTLARAAEACRLRGATKIYATASHGVFVGQASQVLAQPALDQVVITNTIPPFRLEPDVVKTKLVVLDAATLFAEAIKRMHTGGSIVELLET